MDSGRTGPDGKLIWLHMSENEARAVIIALSQVFSVIRMLGSRPNEALRTLFAELESWVSPDLWTEPKTPASSRYGRKMGDEEESG